MIVCVRCDVARLRGLLRRAWLAIDDADVYADMTSVPPGIVRTDEAVAAIRQQRSKAQQTQQAQEMINQGASAAKDLSQASLEGDSALSALMQSGGQSA